MIGRDWTHLGVAKLYTDISRNGYKMLYLTSRAIGQADTTREYLKGIKQNGFQLPDGPVIMSPDRLMTSLHRCVPLVLEFMETSTRTEAAPSMRSEVIMRKPEVFKMACLRDIARLFGERSRSTPGSATALRTRCPTAASTFLRRASSPSTRTARSRWSSLSSPATSRPTST